MTLAEKIGQMTLVDRTAITPEEVDRVERSAPSSAAAAARRRPTTRRRGGDGRRLPARRRWRPGWGSRSSTASTPSTAHGNVRGATVFPHNIGLGAANDPDARRDDRAGRRRPRWPPPGIRWNFAPVVAVPQDIRWGRTYEGYSEDAAHRVAARRRRSSAGCRATAARRRRRRRWRRRSTSSATAARRGARRPPADFQIDQGDTRDGRGAAAGSLPAAVRGRDRRRRAHDHGLVQQLERHEDARQRLPADRRAEGRARLRRLPRVGLGGHRPDPRRLRRATSSPSINAGIDMVMVPVRVPGVHRRPHGGRRARRGGRWRASTTPCAGSCGSSSRSGLFERPFPDARRSPTVGSADAPRARPRGRAGVGSCCSRTTTPRCRSIRRRRSSSWPAPAPTTSGCRAAAGRSTARGARARSRPGTTILDGIRATVAPDDACRARPVGRLRRRDRRRRAAGRRRRGDRRARRAAVRRGPRRPRRPRGCRPADLELLARVRPRAERLVVVLLSGRPLVVTDQLADWDAFVAAWLPGTEGNGVADVLFGQAPVHRAAAVHVAALERAAADRSHRTAPNRAATARCSRAASVSRPTKPPPPPFCPEG